MPIYEYRYKDGDQETVEILHSMSESARTEHLGRPVKRIITGAGFILKGSWPGKSIKKGTGPWDVSRSDLVSTNVNPNVNPTELL